MALFGFNKTKSLASAEKYVQQGKLQNAISEYEKIVKEDPKDLNVINTIGDLNARLGNNDKAIVHFKNVAEAYAKDGFTLRAIALYKKVTKLAPQALEHAERLGELYQKQGLYSEARAQYVAVAEQYVRSNAHDAAAGLLRRIVEFDPENQPVQLRLADLLVKAGNPADAMGVFLTAAKALHDRGALDQSLDACERVLKIDKKNAEAILLKGSILSELGRCEDCVTVLSEIPAASATPACLDVLCRAFISLQRFDEAYATAQKMPANEGGLALIQLTASAMIEVGSVKRALQMLVQHSEALSAAHAEELRASMKAAVAGCKNDLEALQMLHKLMQTVREESSYLEVTELLAQKLAQSGDNDRARELYAELAELEPDNPLHTSGVARLDEEQPRTPAEVASDAPVFTIEQLEELAPKIDQQYSEAVEQLVATAISDAELGISYGQSAKAIEILSGALAEAPEHVRLHMKLLPLLVRASRNSSAIECCRNLIDAYSAAGQTAIVSHLRSITSAIEAGRTAELLASSPEPFDVLEKPTAANEAEPMAGERPARFGDLRANTGFVASSVAEFDLGPAPTEEASVEESAPPSAKAFDKLEEFDLSDDWEQAMNAPQAADEVVSATANTVPDARDAAEEELIAGIDEAQLYLEQDMLPEAEAAIEHLQRLAPKDERVRTLAAALLEKQAPPKASAPVATTEDLTASLEEDDDPLSGMLLDLEAEVTLPEFASEPETGPIAERGSALAAQPEAVIASPIAPPAVQQPPTAAKEMPQEIAAAVAPQPDDAIANSSMLADLLAEFREDVEDAAPTSVQDLDTHYQLGVAFREMGLLDEAIGELQKVCNSVESGSDFTQLLQAYTLLAQCFIDKEVPQAAVGWYSKALSLHELAPESKWALHYDLANAFEASGDRQSALNNLLLVYSGNIDYRDTAERIKELRR